MENSEIINKTLQLVKENLELFIEQNLREVYGSEKFIIFLNNPNPDKNESQEQMIDYRDIESNYRKKFKDVSYFINLFLKHWEGIFKPKLTNNYVLSLIHSIRYFRNRWAHQSNMSEREVYRLADESQALLEEIKINNIKGYETIEEMNRLRLTALEKLVFAEMHKHNNVGSNNASQVDFHRVQEANKNNNNSNLIAGGDGHFNYFVGNENGNYNYYQDGQNYVNNLDRVEFYNYYTENAEGFYNEQQNDFNGNIHYLNQNCDYKNTNDHINLQYQNGAENFVNQSNSNNNNNNNNLIHYDNQIKPYENMNNNNFNYSKEQNNNNYENTFNKKNLNAKFNKYNSHVPFEEDKQMQEYDKIQMKNQHYNSLINKNLKNENNHFNVYVHSDDEN